MEGLLPVRIANGGPLRHHGRDFAGSPTGPGSYAFGVPYQSHSDNDKGDGRQASGNVVDPTTLRQDAFGTNWIGGDNPQTVNGEPAYGVPPVNLAGIPALKHDKAYDQLGIEGLRGVVLDPRASKADYQFVEEEMMMGVLAGTTNQPLVML